MLKYKLLKWFAGLVIVYGALSALLGSWIINRQVVQEAQTRVRYDLNAAWSVYHARLNALETIVKLVGARSPLIDACSAAAWDDQRTWNDVRGILGKHLLDFNLDFLVVVTPEGRVVARANPSAGNAATGDYRTNDPLVDRALRGAATSGTVLLSPTELSREGDGLADRAFVPLQETPRARPTTKQIENRGLVMMAAAPIEKNGRTVGAIYAGVLLNHNDALVDDIQNIVFGQERYGDQPRGTVTVFLGDTRVATTVRLANSNRAFGTRVSAEVADRVLDNAKPWEDRAFVVRDWYLTKYDPILDPQKHVIGMLYVGTLEQPFRDLGRSVLLRYSGLVVAALLIALLMASFIAGRIARPLHRLAESANRMRRGGDYQPVPSDLSCAETTGLIQSFNQMASTLMQRENELTEANQRLASTNQTLTGLNAQYMETLQFVSHELNSPLSSIMNYTYMLRQRLLGSVTDKQEHALEVISSNLKRVMEMTRHYLNLARIESGELQPVPTRVVVREDVIAPILNSLQADIHARAIMVEDLIDPKVIVQTDLNMTRELFENLISNAVKYGRPGGLVTLSCQIDGKWARFSVRNEGEGIPPERRGELFQKFSRLQLGDSRKTARGTGLGLFIAKAIVEAHGGSISVDSQVGQWTVFRCTLPLADETGQPASAKTAGAAVAPP